MPHTLNTTPPLKGNTMSTISPSNALTTEMPTIYQATKGRQIPATEIITREHNAMPRHTSGIIRLRHKITQPGRHRQANNNPHAVSVPSLAYLHYNN